MKELTKEDWQLLTYIAQRHFTKARPKPHEAKPSEEFVMQEDRVMNYLLSMAFRK